MIGRTTILRLDADAGVQDGVAALTENGDGRRPVADGLWPRPGTMTTPACRHAVLPGGYSHGRGPLAAGDEQEGQRVARDPAPRHA